MFLLDTNVWIEVFKKNPLVRKEFGTVENSEIGLSAIVLGELKVGFKKRRKQSNSVYLALSDLYHIIPIDVMTADIYAEIRTELEEKGTPIGSNDLWIASQAIQMSATLVTHNVREFSRVPGLTVVDWQQ